MYFLCFFQFGIVSDRTINTFCRIINVVLSFGRTCQKLLWRFILFLLSLVQVFSLTASSITINVCFYLLKFLFICLFVLVYSEVTLFHFSNLLLAIAFLYYSFIMHQDLSLIFHAPFLIKYQIHLFSMCLTLFFMRIMLILSAFLFLILVGHFQVSSSLVTQLGLFSFCQSLLYAAFFNVLIYRLNCYFLILICLFHHIIL